MGYKAFGKGMICQGKQYQENTDYEETGAENCCNPGVMHYCEDPMDCLNYYPLIDENGDFTEFAEVEPLDDVLKSGDKCATKKLRIGAKLSFNGFVEAAVNVLIEKTKGKKQNSAGDWARIGSSGNEARIASSGNEARIVSSGVGARIGSSGNEAQIGSSGVGAQIGSSGDWSRIGSSGDWARICSSGDWALIGSSGRYAQIGSSGDGARIKCEKDHAVVVCAGKKATVCATTGTWITLAEYGEWDGDGYPCVCVKSAKIDGKTLKPDTWYKLEKGEFVEVTE